MSDSEFAHEDGIDPVNPESVPSESERPATPTPARRRRSIFEDPMVRRMTWFAIGLVVIYLVGVLSALVLGVLGQSAPKTAVESDVQYYELQTAKTPKDAKVWTEYIGALIQAEQYMKAQDVIDRASASVEQSSTQAFRTMQVDLDFATGDYKSAIKNADKVRELLEKDYEKQKKTPGSAASRKLPIHENYYLVLITKAEAQVKLGDEKGAIETLTLFLEDNKTAADVFARRGALRAEQGDKEGAEADFRETLKYIPDDPAALEGLKKIGVTQ